MVTIELINQIAELKDKINEYDPNEVANYFKILELKLEIIKLQTKLDNCGVLKLN